MKVNRRAVFFAPLALLATLGLTACRREVRCARCGMVINAASRWQTTLRSENGTIQRFDTPQCAYAVWRGSNPPGGIPITLYALGYYTQTELPASALRFALGSNVLGPMGADLVPVEEAYAGKFAAEHQARAMLSADEVNRSVLEHLK